jgi:transcriptional regulator with PAS, ATPase and Fis domain
MDIPLLVNHMVDKFNRLKNKDFAGVSEVVMLRLMVHDYPADVRELENIVEHGFALHNSGLIEMNHLPPELREAKVLTRIGFTETRTLKAMERLMIEEALDRHKGNRRLAAVDLKID